jgi:hypothetical protein
VSKKIVAASKKIILRLGKASPIRSWFFLEPALIIINSGYSPTDQQLKRICASKGFSRIILCPCNTESSKLILAARYDGMDLPGDTCRLMILDELPMGVQFQLYPSQSPHWHHKWDLKKMKT